MHEEHPFAEFIRILGKGKNGSRSLTQDEAYRAMQMILSDQALPVQLGAFLMLMRVKEESPEELAGFVLAARESFHVPDGMPEVHLDWSSYAGKRRQLPWFLLAAMLLAANGIRVFMHGAGGPHARVYTPETLHTLGIPQCHNFTEVAQQIEQRNFAFMSLFDLSPKLDEIMKLRAVFGLRSPVHTLSRMLNPCNAKVMLQGIFHPGYRNIHQEAAAILGQPHMIVLKGEGGEIERNPDGPCLVQSVHEGVLKNEEWPAMFKGPRHLKDETMDVRRLPALWRGEIHDEYAEATIVGTVAVALNAMGQADTIASAEAKAGAMWANRSTAWLNAA